MKTNSQKKLMTLSFAILVLSSFLSVSCAKKAIEDAVASATSGKYLYIATGACYVAALTGESYSKRISRVNLLTGVIDSTVADYNSAAVEYPAAIANIDNDYMAVLVENTSGRRVDKVAKKKFIPNSEISTFIPSNAGLSAQLRAMIGTADGGLLLSRSTAIEKYNSAKTRVMVGANPWGNISAGACSGSTTLITSVAALSNGKIAFGHAAASPNNRIGIVASTGFSTGTDCVSNASPSTAHYPVAMVYIPAATAGTGQLLVAFGRNAAGTTGIDGISTYDVNESAGTATLVGDAFKDPSILLGISAMTYDPDTKSVYVANGSTSGGNTIEKFTWNPTTKTLSRVGTTPFVGLNSDTRCVTSMMVAN